MTDLPRLMILGHARHGKDTAAEWLQKNHGYRFVSSSWFMAERVVLPAFRALKGEKVRNDLSGGWEFPPEYVNAQACYDDRQFWRSFWFDQIAAFNANDPSRLTREIFKAGNNIYVGLRNPREFHAAKLAKAFDLAIWIDASDRCPLEPASSMSCQPWMADVIVDNNGSLADLDKNMAILYNKWIRPLEKPNDWMTKPLDIPQFVIRGPLRIRDTILWIDAEAAVKVNDICRFDETGECFHVKEVGAVLRASREKWIKVSRHEPRTQGQDSPNEVIHATIIGTSS